LWFSGVGVEFEFKLLVSFAKEPYKRDNILQKRPIEFSGVGVECEFKRDTEGLGL